MHYNSKQIWLYFHASTIKLNIYFFTSNMNNKKWYYSIIWLRTLYSKILVLLVISLLILSEIEAQITTPITITLYPSCSLSACWFQFSIRSKILKYSEKYDRVISEIDTKFSSSWIFSTGLFGTFRNWCAHQNQT